MDFDLVKQRVEHARLALGLSRSEFAQRTGVSIRTFDLWDKTDAHPRMGTIRKIAEATGRPVGWFFGIEENAA